MQNVLEINKAEFVEAIKTFNIRYLPRTALLAFEGGIAVIESGDRVATMRARGEWHGRAWFSPNILKALAQVPPHDDPVVIVYDGAKLRIDTVTVGCKWEQVSKAFIEDAIHPSLLDLLAMDRTLPRSEIHEPRLAKRILDAKVRLTDRIAKAASLLKDAEISQGELWFLVEQRILERLHRRRD